MDEDSTKEQKTIVSRFSSTRSVCDEGLISYLLQFPVPLAETEFHRFIQS